MRRILHLVVLASVAGACSSAPRYAGWTQEQLYEHGQEAFQAEDWDEARRSFERLVLTFPNFAEVIEARHYLARAFYSDDDFLSAVSEYTRIVQVAPDHERVHEGWLGLCRSYAAMSPHHQRDQQFTIQARTTCQNVANDFTGTPVGDSANVVAMEMHSKLAAKAYAEAHFYFQRDIYESAERIYLDLIATFPDTDSAPQAIARLISIYEEWGWDVEREEYTTRLLERYPDSPEAKALDQPAR